MVKVRNEQGLKSKNKMICFPYAGGCASFYEKWKNEINEIEICPIQLPGREESFRDEKIYDMETAVEQVLEKIEEYVDQSTIFFGHSMGAKMAYEVIKELEKRAKRVRCLIVSGSSAPDIPPKKMVHHLPEKDLLDELQRLSGTPDELLEDKDLLKCFLPMIRADFTLDETYMPILRVKLSCPIVAWGGTEDFDVYKEDLEAWKDFSYGNFQMKHFHGNHFFIKDCEEEVFNEMRKVMKEI